MAGRAYVLLSGGIDSTTTLYQAMEDFLGQVVGVSVYYGQRHRKEMEYARASCKTLAIPLHTIDLTGIIPRSMLTDPSQEVPSISYRDIAGVSPTYVPFRNGLLLSSITSYVAGEIEEYRQKQLTNPGEEWAIYFGAHAEDAQSWAYPDCTPEFIGAMANAIYVGSYRAIRLHTPLEWLDKVGVIDLGERLGVNWANTWSCYKGEERHCGVCPTCRARREGFIKAGVDDPTEYAARSNQEELQGE